MTIVEGVDGVRAWIVSGMGRIASPSGFGCSERRRISLDLFFRELSILLIECTSTVQCDDDDYTRVVMSYGY